METRIFVKTDVRENSNKVWQISILDDGTVRTANGRVGSKMLERAIGNGRVIFDRKIREKTRSGYRPVETMGDRANDRDGKEITGSARRRTRSGAGIL